MSSPLVTAQSAKDSLSIERLDEGGLVLNLETVIGTRYRVENSLDLENWNSFTEFLASETTTSIELPSAAEQALTFFRAEAIADPQQSALDENRAKWASIGWQNYRLRIDVSENIPDQVSQGIITVENDQVVDVNLPLSDGDNLGFQFNYPLSVEGLFDRVQSFLNRNPVDARITYHPDFGFPLEVFVDFERLIADEEAGFRVSMLGPTKVVDALSFELPDDPYRVHGAEIVGNTLLLDLEYGGGCRVHMFAFVDLMPGVFAESEPPRPVVALRHDSNNDLCRALIRETRTFDLTPLAVSAAKTYGSPIPMILEFGASANGTSTPVSIVYTPAGSETVLVQRATSQAWVGGVPGSGSGIDYRFTLTVLSDEVPTISDVWIGQRRFDASVRVPSGQSIETVMPGDEIELVCQFRRVPVFSGEPFASEIVDWREEPPMTDGPSFEGAALLQYERNGVMEAVIFPTIESLPELLFP